MLSVSVIVLARRRWTVGARAHAFAVLQVHEPGAAPRNVSLPRGVVRIGRDPANGIFLADSKVSARHAELHVDAGGAVIVDPGSTNGTWVNGRQVQRQTLNHGDVIELGDTRLLYV
jgi:pSer/pThr/pTyr-binding forkhead associated (FHA) protein